MNLFDYRTIAVGSKLPITHCNPKKATAVIFRDADKITFYCSRCGETKSLRLRRVLDSIVPPKVRDTFILSQTCCIPPDTIYDITNIPHSFFGWIGPRVSWSRICTTYKVGYSAALDRAVLPVYALDDLYHTKAPIGAQFRSLCPTVTPKYLTSAGTSGLAYSPPMFPGVRVQACIVVEDILSSIVLKEHYPDIYPIAILGTNINVQTIHKILKNYPGSDQDPVILWFDDDAAGLKAVKNARNAFQLLGKSPKVIITREDPKHASEVLSFALKEFEQGKDYYVRLNFTSSNEVPEGVQGALRGDPVGHY